MSSVHSRMQQLVEFQKWKASASNRIPRRFRLAKPGTLWERRHMIGGGRPFWFLPMYVLGGNFSWQRIKFTVFQSFRVLAVVGIGLGLSGCKSSSQPTNTGLPYYPLNSPLLSDPRFGSPPPLPGSAIPLPGENDWRQAAARWMGTPYRDGGHDRQGVDCSGYTDILYREVVGRGIPRTSMGQWLEGKAVSVENMRPGDLVFFQTVGTTVSHVGLSLGGSEFTHASSSRGVTISSLNEDYWRERFLGVRRMSP